MADVYYDPWEFRLALSYVDTNPIKANTKLKEYIDKYPKDYSACSYYVYTLIVLGKFEEAEKFLGYIEQEYKKDTQFLKEPGRVETLKKDIVFNKVKILSYLGRYKELYQYCLNNQEKIQASGLLWGYITLYCKKKLGKIDTSRRDAQTYFIRQLVEYQESDFLDHVKKHLADHNSQLDAPNENIFTPDFPFDEVFAEIKKSISDDKKICWGVFDDTYVFRYDGCGRKKYKLVDYFKVVCFHGTQDFITMLPVEEGKDLPHIDLNYLQKKDDKNTPQRPSALEKFNKKFKRK